MNWLAHLVLSESAAPFRVGNVLADILTIGELRALPPSYQEGIARHRAIDSFTDSHPVYRRSVARLEPPFRRYGGVIIDIYYDHLLTQHWSHYSAEPLDTFVDRFHDDVESCRFELPPHALFIFERMRSGRWLSSYGDLEGVRITLARIAKRLRRPFDLAAVTDELGRQSHEYVADFATFFPQIKSRFGQ